MSSSRKSEQGEELYKALGSMLSDTIILLPAVAYGVIFGPTEYSFVFLVLAYAFYVFIPYLLLEWGEETGSK